MQAGLENVQLYHDVGNGIGPTTNQKALVFDPWLNLVQGVSKSTRIGDKVTPVGYKLRLWFANKPNFIDVLYRLIVVILPRAIGTVAVSPTNVDLFRATDIGTNNSTMCGHIDKETVKKVLYDKTFRLQNSSGFDTKEVHMIKKLYFKTKRARPIEYINNSNVHKNNFLAVYLIPYDSWGTLQTDNIASCAYIDRIYYKDA